jgi:hypothetical protein
MGYRDFTVVERASRAFDLLDSFERETDYFVLKTWLTGSNGRMVVDGF